MKESLKGILPVILVFVLLNGALLISSGLLEKWGFHQPTLVIGNALIFLITLGSYFIAKRNLHNPNPNVFVRAVIGSIMVKMFLVAAAAFIYIFLHRSEINKPALFTCMGLYLLYTFLEIAALMKMLKQKTNG